MPDVQAAVTNFNLPFGLCFCLFLRQSTGVETFVTSFLFLESRVMSSSVRGLRYISYLYTCKRQKRGSTCEVLWAGQWALLFQKTFSVIMKWLISNRHVFYRILVPRCWWHFLFSVMYFSYHLSLVFNSYYQKIVTEQNLLAKYYASDLVIVFMFLFQKAQLRNS